MTDFGKGYVTCLFQFANHAHRLEERLGMWADMRLRNPDLFSEVGAVETWANGASDHLYDLRTPRRGVPKAEIAEARSLQGRWLDIGHGFRGSIAAPDEARQSVLRARSLVASVADRAGVSYPENVAAAIELDRAIGVAADRGSWACDKDLHREERTA